ncbi:hypothetical protein [Thiogranum longum]
MTRLFHSRAIVILALLVWSPHNWAEYTNRPPVAISDAELDQRLEFIQTRLAKQRPGARYWQYGWTGFYAISTAAQGILAVDADDNDDEVNYIVGAVKSTGALALLLLRPLPAVHSSTELQAMPSQSREQRIRKLEQGEAMLRENAMRAGERTSWKRHFVGIAGNLIGGVAIAAFGDSSDAVASTLIGIAVREATIWSQPSRATTDLEDYRNNKWAQRGGSAATWRVVPTANGVAVNIRF